MVANEKLLELQEQGFCVLRGRFRRAAVEACREAFWPVLQRHLEDQQHEANRGPHRHFLPMPFEPPCFAPEFFFDDGVLGIVRGVLRPRIVADQWGCDVALRGSEYQPYHVDYQRPLFEESSDLALPPYMLMVSFGMVPISASDGPIEIATGTHRMPREAAIRCAESGGCPITPVLLDIGDVLIRHPWAVHRGTPNRSDTPRALASIRYVRRWYWDDSRAVATIPTFVWRSLTEQQRGMLRFPTERVG